MNFFFIYLYIIDMTTLRNKIIKSGMKENEINRQMAEYSLNANLNKVFKPRKHINIIYGKNKNDIINSGLNEEEINKNLEQISYNARNGQRQKEGTYKPEGVEMLGQLGREKPLTAITRDMIEKYQESQNAPIVRDGEIMAYNRADYEPKLTFDDTIKIDEVIERYKQGREDIINKITNIEDNIIYSKNLITSLKEETKEKGFNQVNFTKLKDELANLKELRQKMKNLEKEVERYDYDIKNLDDNKRELNKRENIANKEEVLKYEQSLKEKNRNRFNIQQEPEESEYEYYKRLKEVEATKYDKNLYGKFSENKNTKELNEKMTELFSDKSFNSEVLKKLGSEDKHLLNINFDNIKNSYLNRNGFNNTRLNPSMVASELIKDINLFTNKNAALLQAMIKRRPQQEIYKDTIELSRDRQEMEARKVIEKAAKERLSSAFLRSKVQPEMQKIIKEIKTEAEEKAAKRKEKAYLRNQELYLRDIEQRLPILESWLERHQDIQDAAIIPQRELINREIIENKNAALNIQRVLRGYKGREQAKKLKETAKEKKKEIQDKQQEIFNRQSQRLTKYEEKQEEKGNKIIEDYLKNKEQLREARKKTYEKKKEIQDKQTAAAANIQKIVRGNQARINAALIRNENRIKARNAIRDEQNAQEAAATNIQSVLRGFKGRQQAKQRTQAERQEIENTERIASQIR